MEEYYIIIFINMIIFNVVDDCIENCGDEVSRGNYDPGSPGERETTENGLIEEAGKTIREYVCTFLLQMEHGIDEKMPLSRRHNPMDCAMGRALLFAIHGRKRWKNSLREAERTNAPSEQLSYQWERKFGTSNSETAMGGNI